MSDLGPQFRGTIEALQRTLDVRHHPALREIVRIFSSFQSNLNAFTTILKAHRWKIGTVATALLLIANPLALVGFGALGPVAGSLAAAWQATMGGYVASGSLFAGLQGAGMTASVALPAVGGTLLALFLIYLAWKHREELKAGATDVQKWVNGDYGNPVNEWWNDKVGRPVTRWWSNTFRKTAKDEAGEEKREKSE